MLEHTKRFDVLDGWRGLSILLVLATHLLPLGPKAWQLNSSSGPFGMALFFTLSGFLITNFLLHRPNVSDFLIRRFARIVPLAWVCMIVALIWVDASTGMWLANLLFYANWPPMQMPEVFTPFWSLCVEMQFYIGIAILVWLLRDRGLLLLPVLCIAVTLFRAMNEVHVAINTYYRVDEILAGCILALAFNQRLGEILPRLIKRLNIWLLIVLLAVSCHPASGFINYFRPYLAALVVGWTLFNHESRLSKVLVNRTLVYIAAISYALYVMHPLLAHTWLGSGEGWAKYVKRPLLFAALFLLAHISTFYFEHRCIALGKRFSAWLLGSKKAIEESKGGVN